MTERINFWQLDFQNDTELVNLKADLDASRRRLDSALFKHLALLAPVAISGMGLFLRGSSGDGLAPAEIAMVAVPAAILVMTVLLSALSLAVAPTNVVTTVAQDGRPVLQPRADWITSLRGAVARTNWHRGFEDNVQFYGFALAAIGFLVPGALSLFG